MTARVYVAPEHLGPGALRISGDEHHYLSRVRRLGPGDEVTLFDGVGHEARARIVRVDRGETALEVEAPETSGAASPFALAVAFAPVKGERTEWAIQKLVEIGVTSLHPMRADRSVVVPRGERAKTRVQRYRAVAAEAARQSQNPVVPEIAPIAPLSEVAGALASAELKLILAAGGRGDALRDRLRAPPPAGAALLVGPEGGFTDAEIESARAAGFWPTDLGPRVLRAETAAVAAAAILQHALGDLG